GKPTPRGVVPSATGVLNLCTAVCRRPSPACHPQAVPRPAPRSTLETHPKPSQRAALQAPPAVDRGDAASRRRGSGDTFPETLGQKYRLIYLLCCRCCQAPWRMFFSSLLDAVAPGLDGSGAFLWCGDLASRTTVSPCGFSRPSPVSRGVLSAMSNLRLCLALRVRSPPWMPLEEARDRTTRGQGRDVVSTQMLPNHLSTDAARLVWR